MHKLDDQILFKKLDPSFVGTSISLLWRQCQSAWSEAGRLEIPSDYKNVSSVLFAGMGGSAYGARIIKSLYADVFSYPLDLVSDYHLPKYVDPQKTLIIAASYSGDTEETLSCVNEGLKIGAKVIGITSGGKLFEILKSHGRPVFRFDPEFNPCRQPRIGQGYMQMGLLSLFNSMGFLSLREKEVSEVISFLDCEAKTLEPQVQYGKNEAKRLAAAFEQKVVNIFGAEFLEGAIHAIRNPFHETGKHFANYFIVPEANHHLMEGLMYPKSLKASALFLFVNSSLYSQAIKDRLVLTREIVEKNGISTAQIDLKNPTRLGQVFELILLGSFTTFYLAMLHGQDPAKIPWVDYFKSKKGG